jgi:hypothetical protein
MAILKLAVISFSCLIENLKTYIMVITEYIRYNNDRNIDSLFGLFGSIERNPFGKMLILYNTNKYIYCTY